MRLLQSPFAVIEQMQLRTNWVKNTAMQQRKPAVAEQERVPGTMEFPALVCREIHGRVADDVEEAEDHDADGQQANGEDVDEVEDTTEER